MAMLEEIRLEKRRIQERLTHLDFEVQKLNDQLNELETAERVLKAWGRKASAARQQTKRPPTTTAPSKNEKRRAHLPPNPRLSLNDASLKAVQAHAKGANANEVLRYLARKFGMTVRPNHLGMALQRHRRAGRLENRDQRWYLTPAV
jgi:hypothetical protein